MNTSNELLSFSRDPPKPDIIASAISPVVSLLRSSESDNLSTSSGAASINESHGAIWFFPKIAAAASSFSTPVRSLKESCNSPCSCVMSFKLPCASKALIPKFFMTIAAESVGDASRAMPVLSDVAALFASTPAFAIVPIAIVASSSEPPLALKIGAAMLIALDKESTSSAELLHACANTFAYPAASSAPASKLFIVAISPADTVSRLPPSPAARFIAGARAFAACSASHPPRAKLRAAVAASFMPNVEFAAALSIALLSISASPAEFFIVALTRLIVLSTSANFLTATVPAPTIGTVTDLVSVEPMRCMLFPMP